MTPKLSDILAAIDAAQGDMDEARDTLAARHPRWYKTDAAQDDIERTAQHYNTSPVWGW
jgi:hypothetical protein